MYIVVVCGARSAAGPCQCCFKALTNDVAVIERINTKPTVVRKVSVVPSSTATVAPAHEDGHPALSPICLWLPPGAADDDNFVVVRGDQAARKINVPRCIARVNSPAWNFPHLRRGRSR